MNRATTALAIGAFTLALGCGGGAKQKQGSGSDMSAMDKKAMASMKMADDQPFGALEHGADYKSYKLVSKQKFLSKPHGKRFVEIYVNDIGYEAYTTGKPFPVGSIIVKPSWQAKDGKPSATPGPIFVMMKKEKGFAKQHNDWWYAIHWEKPPARFSKDGKGLYWRSPSKRVNYCWECHENYDNEVGLPPRAMRAWTAPADGN